MSRTKYFGQTITVLKHHAKFTQITHTTVSANQNLRYCLYLMSKVGKIALREARCVK